MMTILQRKRAIHGMRVSCNTDARTYGFTAVRTYVMIRDHTTRPYTSYPPSHLVA